MYSRSNDSGYERSLEAEFLVEGDRNGQIRLKSTAAIAGSQLAIRPAATAANRATEFY